MSGTPRQHRHHHGGSPASGLELVSRRRFLHISGLTVAGGALLAACGNGDGDGGGGDTAGAPTTTTTMALGDNEILLLRTATSLELAAVEIYQGLLDSGALSAPVAEAITLFQTHHQEHAEALQGETKKAGATPISEANDTVLDAVAGRVAAIASEGDAAQLAYDVERIAAATYVSGAGEVDHAVLAQLIMSIGGVEARHVALLGTTTGRPQVYEGGFAVVEGAVPPGAGL